MAKLSKEKVLADIGTLVQNGDVTFDELQKVYTYNVPESAKHATPEIVAPAASVTSNAASDHTSKSIGNVLYVVGTLIVCLGIYLLIAQNWSQLNTPVRVLVTFGLGLAVFLAAYYRARKQLQISKDLPNKDLLTASLFTIGSVALIIGAGVVVTEMGGSLTAPGTATAVAMAVSAAFLAFYLGVMRSVMVLACSISVALAAYFAAIEFLTADMTKPEPFYYFEIAFAGLLLIGTGVLARTRVIASQLAGTLYGVGIFVALGALFFLTLFSGFDFGSSDAGDHSYMPLLYDLLYPVVLAAGVALSVYVHSRDVLVISALFLTGYIFEVSNEYFSNFLGGSIALCLAGVLVMLMAYGATRFAKRYVVATKSPANNL